MLDIDMEFKKGILVIKLKGDLTTDTSYMLEKQFYKVIKKSGQKYCMLNIENINTIDKTGIKSIKNCYYNILKNGGKFILKGMDNIFKKEIDSLNNLYNVTSEEGLHNIISL